MHKFFILFLILSGMTAVVALGIHGRGYYATPLERRPFRDDHPAMKPSGSFSHGLGILGASMIIIGVTTYSTRKRVRRLWKLGRLSRWLEFHIFLCLMGPVLVIYHTTFKAGGIAAISLWTMLSVAFSGGIGRFLYVLIPRSATGMELTTQQINEEFDRLGAVLRETETGALLLSRIDAHFVPIQRPDTFGQACLTFLRLQSIKRAVKRDVRRAIARSSLSGALARTVYKTAAKRAALLQRSILLVQAESLFYYWHAIHLPFTAIMFITLILHVGVAVWMGYRWAF